ncbi:conserved hypothetical protein [Kangiella koreensis DSM 16069]|uniref:DUF2062 domain-containing protein n=1 Tax=Kangiella koreensis (strain DSM 16069 / JCM 12317 / KCTC 12182 / SW-125) TaxID=523791 RepID=C7RC03_KANKD|nr:DUF2062 domain-containing protein [Kangiella koreensis]ACV26795.1 conserved hypothetical protein [Kangiella koreensis DSM 16069]
MPRKIFKKYLPDHKKIKENRYMKVFGNFIHDPGLWHLNRYSASGAFAVGLFCGFLPIPFQMVVAAALAIYFRVNLPISVVLCWITNPITIVPMFYFAYKVGAWILGVPPNDFSFELSFAWLQSELIHIWKPFLLGCLICGGTLSLIGYHTISLLWRLHVVRAWRARQARWKERLLHTLHLDQLGKKDDDDEEDKTSDSTEETYREKHNEHRND